MIQFSIKVPFKHVEKSATGINGTENAQFKNLYPKQDKLNEEIVCIQYYQLIWLYLYVDFTI